MKDLSQNDIILNHLRGGESITTIESYNLYWITDLQGCIHKLKKKGIKINDCWVERTNRLGKTKRFKEYFLAPPESLLDLIDLHNEKEY